MAAWCGPRSGKTATTPPSTRSPATRSTRTPRWKTTHGGWLVFFCQGVRGACTLNKYISLELTLQPNTDLHQNITNFKSKVKDPNTGLSIADARAWLTDPAYIGGHGDNFKTTREQTFELIDKAFCLIECQETQIIVGEWMYYNIHRINIKLQVHHIFFSMFVRLKKQFFSWRICKHKIF